jgi:hypothetical protein
MKTTIVDSFNISADTFWREVFFSRDFLERMYKEALDCESVQFLEESGDTAKERTRRLAFRQRIDAPGPIRKLFGDTTTMEERGRFDPNTKRWRFEMIPDRMADKIRITGETWLEPAGEGKVERVCALDYSVSIFGIGALVEKFMASATAESYAKQTKFTQEFIKQKGLK